METVITARVDKALYAKIVKRQQDMKQLTGIKPSISAVVRLLVEEATGTRKRRRRAAA